MTAKEFFDKERKELTHVVDMCEQDKDLTDIEKISIYLCMKNDEDYFGEDYGPFIKEAKDILNDR